MAWGSSPSRAGESFLSSAVPAPSPLLTLLSFPGLPQTRANMHVDEVKFSFDVADNARHRQLRQRLLRYRKGQIERRKAFRSNRRRRNREPFISTPTPNLRAAQTWTRASGGVSAQPRFRSVPRLVADGAFRGDSLLDCVARHHPVAMRRQVRVVAYRRVQRVG